MASQAEIKQLKAKLGDEKWRLNNLYWIRDKKGNKVKFRMNWAQARFYKSMWYLNIILKARQLGFTTFIQIFMLDRCLFNPNIAAGVVAHNREDAEDFFVKKIKFAYDNLPDWLTRELTAVTDSAKQLSFSNGSSIRVGTSLRSGTYQYLHVSEFGKLCAKYPDKAEEIVTGALNTVDVGQFVFIESTADGAFGHFFTMCKNAMGKARDTLSKLDYFFHFYSWWEHPEYLLDEPVPIDDTHSLYFAMLEDKHGIEIDEPHKWWYVKKAETQRAKMKQEFPSTPDEAFEQISEHAVYGAELGKLMEQGRITSVPFKHELPVYTFWDLGRSKTDSTAIWFMQHEGQDYRFLKFYQNFKKPISHYAEYLQNQGYVYGGHYLPHDGGTNDFEMKDYKERLEKLVTAPVHIVPRVQHLNIGIQAVREKLPLCWFDKDGTAEGVTALKAYRYEFDEKDAAYKAPRHDWASHPADAFRQFAQGYRGPTDVAWGNKGRRGRKQAAQQDTSWMV